MHNDICFEHHCAHHQEVDLYECGIWYSTYLLVCRLHTGESHTGCAMPDAVLIQFYFLMMSTVMLETCRGLQ